MNVLVTGATGYIGGRLVPRLLERGHRVRVLVRGPDRIAGRPWAERVERHTGDLLDPGSLSGAFDGVEAAYYLVHGMTAGGDFAARDLRAASNFVGAARGVGLVVYLGGLLPEGEASSEHLRSRAEVGALLRKALPTTELRAGPIIGSGSASFEMVRYLTERLPVMVAPRWILNPVQPIGIDDVLAYLVETLEHPPLGVVEVGADRLSFRRMMLEYAAARGLRRKIFPVPVLAPGLAALWIGLVTPISNRLAVPLVEGIVKPVTADTGKAEAEFPDLRPIGYREAVERALGDSTGGDVETRWSGALGGAPSYELRDREGLMREVRARDVTANPETVFRTVAALGGDRGWPVSFAWKARGVLDQLVGGPGLRRGRRDPLELLAGETLDFWRVERVEPPHLLRLRAEMKVPGWAWLQWETEATGEGETRLWQTALFAPRGLPGLVYWYALYPIHAYVFSRTVDRVVREAEGWDAGEAGTPRSGRPEGGA